MKTMIKIKIKILTKQKLALLVGVSALGIAGFLAAGGLIRLGITSSFKVPEFYNKNIIPGEIIVKFKNGKTFDFSSNFKSQNKIQKLDKVFDKQEIGFKKKGGKKLEAFQKYGLDRIHKIKLPKEADIKQVLIQLSRNPNIEYAEPNYIAKLFIEPNDSFYSNYLWGLNTTGQTVKWWGGGAFHEATGTPGIDISAQEAWDIQTGIGRQEIVVAVLDSGIDYNHPDLVGKIYTNSNEIANNGVDDDNNGFIDDFRGWDFAEGDNDVFDGFGHGTFVSGIIGAISNNNHGVVGVNWNVKILPIKVFGAEGEGSGYDTILEGLQYIPLFNDVKVVNASLGGILASYAQQDVITALDEMGVLFVAAAGNDSENIDGVNPSFPAAYANPNIISVAALHPTTGGLMDFSNYGPIGVDLAAPGGGNWSTLPTSGFCVMCGMPTPKFKNQVIITESNSGVYGGFSGTSFAAPYVTGAAALLLAQNPNLTHYQVKDLILRGVDFNDNLKNKVVTGGYLNLEKSLKYILWDYNNDGHFDNSDSNTLNQILLRKMQCPEGKDCDPNGDDKEATTGDLITIVNESLKFGDPIDYNNDGVVNTADTQILRDVLLRKINCPAFKNCDVNSDGKIATMGDVVAHSKQVILRQPLALPTDLKADISGLCVGGSNYSAVKFSWNTPEGADAWQFEILRGVGDFPDIYYIEDLMQLMTNSGFFVTFNTSAVIPGHTEIVVLAKNFGMKSNTTYRWRIRSFDFQKEWRPTSDWAYGSFTTPGITAECPFLQPKVYDLKVDLPQILTTDLQIPFSWKFEDPDDYAGYGGENYYGTQKAYQFQISGNSDFSSVSYEETESKENNFFNMDWRSAELKPLTYYWRGKVQDNDDQWSDWAMGDSFLFNPQWPPTALDFSVDTSQLCVSNRSLTFKWRFFDPNPGDTQTSGTLTVKKNNRLDNAISILFDDQQTFTFFEDKIQTLLRLEGDVEYGWELKLRDNTGLWSERIFGPSFKSSCQSAPTAPTATDLSVDTSQLCNEANKFLQFNWRFSDVNLKDKQAGGTLIIKRLSRSGNSYTVVESFSFTFSGEQQTYIFFNNNIVNYKLDLEDVDYLWELILTDDSPSRLSRTINPPIYTVNCR